ncbi:MAG: hypothetical protein HY741_28615 [Chloroflexi bacterium]|nr:hypothetical protein [Chloroflexota bacterium]
MQARSFPVAVLVLTLVLIFYNTSSASEWSREPIDNAAQSLSEAANNIAAVSSASVPCREFCVGWAVGGAADGYAVILRTDDSGVTWKRQGRVGMIPNVELNGVSAADTRHAWVVGGKVILYTRDGGLTWEQQVLPNDLPTDFELFQVKALDNRTAFAVGSAGVLLTLKEDTRSRGGVWTRMPTVLNMPPIQYSDVDAVDATHVWAVGGVVSGINPRTGLAVAFYNGVRWQTQLVTHSTNDCNSFIGVSAVDRDTAWAVGGPNCPPYKTTNGGDWRAIGKPVSPGIFDTNRIVAVTRDLVWITHDNGIYRTTNGGRKWVQTPAGCGGPAVCYGISAAGSRYAWAADGGFPPSKLFRWVHGNRWKSQPVPANASISLVSFVGARR